MSFNWLWIKKKAKKDELALGFVNLAIKEEIEPHDMSGKAKIADWLDKIEAMGSYYVNLRELQLKWKRSNLPKLARNFKKRNGSPKNFRNEGLRNRIQSNKTGGVI